MNLDLEDYSDLIDDVGGNIFDSLEAAEPVPDLLPHRGTAYSSVSNGNPFKQFVDTPNQSQYSPRFSEEDLEMMAEYEVDLFMAKTDIGVELVRGGLSSVIAGNDDIIKLQQFQSGTIKLTEIEIQDISERIELKKQFEAQQPQNLEQERKFLKKVIKYDLQKRANSGELEFPSMTKIVYQMISNRLMFISGKHPKVFSIVGRALMNKVTDKFF